MRGSIYRRLLAQLVGAAAVLAAVLFVLVQGFARQIAVESQDEILLASATAILESVSVQQGSLRSDMPYSALAMLGNVAEERVFYQISLGGEVLSGYGDLPEKPADGVRAWTGAYLGADIRLVELSRALTINGQLQPVAVRVAQTQDGLEVRLRQISATTLSLGAVFFLIATGLAFLAARGAVRPLNELAGAVARRGPSDLRPVTQAVPAEMAPLTGALNAFIDRLARSLSRSEDFIAEAAHRVRTPLATVRAKAEVTLRRSKTEENRDALRQMITAVDESSRAAGQILDHAMVAFRTDQLTQDQMDLGGVAAEITQRFEPVAQLKDITLIVSGAPCPVTGDPILVQNALTNLMDNAIKYSPRDTQVHVEVLCDERTGAVQVCDQGPGFPEDDVEHLTERFARGANAGETVGSGLGLTIAQDVARAHGGSLQLNTRKEGGACVTLVLPR
ncbi:sensor histidine kinase [Roseobacteraceae bacterium S113]